MLTTRNMKLYLPFERNANDFSGNGNNGTVSGASLVGGKFGKCYSFDGVDDRIVLDGVLPCGAGSTIALWMTFDEMTSGIHYILGTTASGIRYNATDNTLLYYQYPAESANYTTISFIPSATWHHVAAVRTTARNVNWYIDGVYIGSSDPGATGTLGVNNIGRRNLPSSPYYYKGKIDSILYYDKSLNANDIKRIYMGLHPLNG